jgi:hypothetical protein
MSKKIVQLNEEVIKGQLKELVRGSVEETLNELLEQEAEKLTQAARYERNEARQGYRSGHCSRNLMLLFLAVPLVCALIGVSGPLAVVCNIVPSQPAFDGIMALSAGSTKTVLKDIGILAVHCIAWFALYILISGQCRKQTV